MPDDHPSLDERMAALDNRIQTLKQRMPPRPVVPLPVPPRKQRDIVKIVLWLFAIVACVLLLDDAVAIFVKPDGHVFVAVEGHAFHVWRDVWEYEAATGSRWIEQAPGTTDLVAVYHGARRSAALEGVASHFLLLVLSVAAIYRLRQERRRVLMWSAALAKGTG